MRSLALTATKPFLSHIHFPKLYTTTRTEFELPVSSIFERNFWPTNVMPRFRAHVDLPAPIPCPRWCAEESATIAVEMKTKHGATKKQIPYILSLLNNKYVCSLPRLAKDTGHRTDFSPEHLR